MPGAGAHTISRFVDRRYHLGDEHDRRVLGDAIARADERWDWRWLAHAMMSSHVHYANLAGGSDPDRFFRSAHTRYAQHVHRRAGGVTLGPVFADRPTLHPIRDSMVPRLVAYLHRNPELAGVVARPRDSQWTTHRAYLRLDEAPPYLDVEWALSVLGFRDTEAGRRRFDDFVMDVDLDEFIWVREEAEALEEKVERSGSPEIDWARLIDAAREVTRLPRSVSIRARRAAASTRLLVALVATRDLGQTYAAVGAALGMSAGAVFNLTKRRGREARVAVLRARVAQLLAA